jgi:hypothetical protein
MLNEETVAGAGSGAEITRKIESGFQQMFVNPQHWGVGYSYIASSC